ncbi:uncharacterized protein NECHADRAFT_86833 [Fusarium vanettenii 77-13-4]|uniref:Uncharacterized protein n=1 Tax=Fusarium vanettenii (strain ATCC MYA-4622 / CBS 123669 / FGSC 9596 / NRRL 45880 / 77-13-4) TaxID=660122 RepID=C7ZK73_FUSV7|nr:uncharacterized protein NECHADRAFT_86833 [Fusarium vanettenii 77-13-4]EEU35625.1 hypothetical protein NECHADRAFT_86833 [Fusarium vanettenii 77-13-4]
MAPLSVMLLINHANTSMPGQWAIFIAKDRKQKGTLFRAVEERSDGINRELRKGFFINPQETVSVITLGAIVDLDIFLLEETAAQVVMPWAKGAYSKKADCREWVFLFVQALVQEGFLRPAVIEKLRLARELSIDGPAIRV